MLSAQDRNLYNSDLTGPAAALARALKNHGAALRVSRDENISDKVGEVNQDVQIVKRGDEAAMAGWSGNESSKDGELFAYVQWT